MPKPRIFTEQHNCYFRLQASDGIIAATADRLDCSDIIRSAVDMWLAHHRWLMQQGHSALSATDYLLKQTEQSQQQPAPPQPNFAPPSAPMASPFQAPNNGRSAA